MADFRVGPRTVAHRLGVPRTVVPLPVARHLVAEAASRPSAKVGSSCRAGIAQARCRSEEEVSEEIEEEVVDPRQSRHSAVSSPQSKFDCGLPTADC
jgi:hypothetical protein